MTFIAERHFSSSILFSRGKSGLLGDRLLGRRGLDRSRSGGGVFLPGALRRLGDQTLFERRGGDADVANLAARQERFHALQIREEAPLGDRGDVHADAAAFFGFTTAPDDAALDGAFAG